jgi:hypothetical protein
MDDFAHMQMKMQASIDSQTSIDEDINPDKGTTTPTKPAQAPPGPLTRARARELNFVMILKNKGPEASYVHAPSMLMMNLPRIKSRCCATYLFLVCQEIIRKVLHHLN